MISVYVAYGERITAHCGVVAGGDVTQVYEPGDERHVVDCRDENHAATVVESWIRDPNTISVRAERGTA